MIRRLALVGSLAVLSAVAFVSKANAQVQPVDFNGTVTSACTFTGTTSGILVQGGGPTGSWVEGTGSIPGFGTGTQGSSTINCASGGQLTTSVPIQFAAPPGFTPAVVQSVVYDGTNYTSANNGGNFDTGAWTKPTNPLIIPANTNTNLQVGMVAGSRTGATVPAGTYSYQVTLTASSN